MFVKKVLMIVLVSVIYWVEPVFIKEHRII